MSTFLSITMLTSETRVYLEPPLEQVKEIQILDSHIPKSWINFNEPQKIYKHKSRDDELEKVFFTIPAGNYTLRSLQQVFLKDKEISNIAIVVSEEGNYLYSTNSLNLRLSEKLSKKLGVHQKILPNKYYKIRWIPDDSHLYLMCDIIESKSSYSNGIAHGGNVELNPSQLLAVIPSKKHPCLRVSQTKNPLNYLTLSILDENGEKPNFNNEPIRIHLKISS